jgi:hypothetical protein
MTRQTLNLHPAVFPHPYPDGRGFASSPSGGLGMRERRFDNRYPWVDPR